MSKLSFLSLGTPPEQVPPEGYAYKCEDLALLKPLFYRIFVTPIANRLTGKTVANDLTFLSELFSVVPVVFGLWFADTAPGWAWALVPTIGFFWYIVLDHLDGTHARRTGTSSPLGELVDHWCDSWNGALVPFAWALCFGAPPFVIAVLAVLGALAYTFAISEQRATGILKLDRIGGNEGMMGMVVTFLLIGAFGRDRVLHASVGFGWDASQVLQFMCGLGCIGTIKNVILRSGTRSIADVIPLFLSSSLVIWWVALGLDYRLASFMVAALTAIVAGRMVLARTTGLPFRWDGMGFGAILAGLAVRSAYPDQNTQLWTGSIVLAVLVLRALADFAWGARALDRWIRPGEALSLLVPAPAPAPSPESVTEKA